MFLCGIKLVLLSISSVICHYRSFHLRQYIGFEIVSIRVKWLKKNKFVDRELMSCQCCVMTKKMLAFCLQPCKFYWKITISASKVKTYLTKFIQRLPIQEIPNKCFEFILKCATITRETFLYQIVSDHFQRERVVLSLSCSNDLFAYRMRQRDYMRKLNFRLNTVLIYCNMEAFIYLAVCDRQQ